MTNEEIIRMARESGLRVGTNISGVVLVGGDAPVGLVHITIEELEVFARLVAAAEREKVARWMMNRCLATGDGETIEDLLNEIPWQIEETEREACAKVCDGLHDTEETFYRWVPDGRAALMEAADAIRARGEA